MFCHRQLLRRRLVPAGGSRAAGSGLSRPAPDEKSPARRVRRGATTSRALPASFAGVRAAPNPPALRLARWEVVLRLHVRHAIRTRLVTDKSISTRGQSGIPGTASPAPLWPAQRGREG